MEIDWEVEIGGGAPVIEAHWPGFIDLRSHPGRIAEVTEAAPFPALASLLLALNGAESPLWTAKCDLFEPEPMALACYIDLLPVEGRVFEHWQGAEVFCREWVARLALLAAPECRPECSIALIVRQAVAGDAEGFGVTAYLCAAGTDRNSSAEGLAAALAGFEDAVPRVSPPGTAD